MQLHFGNRYHPKWHIFFISMDLKATGCLRKFLALEIQPCYTSDAKY